MLNRYKKIFLVLLLLSGIFLTRPSEVYARNIFQNIGRAIRKTVSFVVKLPDKSTRWMGPVLGPIASNILSANLSASSKIGSIFIKAQRTQNIIDNIDEQRRYVKELKNAYKDQANELDKYAQQIREAREDLAERLTKNEIKFDDFIKQAVALEKLAQTYDKTADEFRHKSETIDERTIIGMVTKNAGNLLINKIQDAVKFELQREISKFVRDDIITRLIGKDLASSDLLIDMLVSDEVGQFLQNKPGINEGELKDRLRNKIKELIKESRSDLKENWKDKIQEALNQLLNEMESDTDKLKDETKNVDTENNKPVVEIPTDEHGCRTGYEWDMKVGKCRQINCNSIENAHWSYTVDCVCGSSGSINENPEDPNKECNYSLSYQSCPGCVYACVHLDEDCPLEGIGGY